MPKLFYTRAASESRQHFKDHDVQRSEALEAALKEIAEGQGRSRARFDSRHRAWLTDVWVTGIDDYDLIVWVEREDGRIVIVHLGRAKL